MSRPTGDSQLNHADSALAEASTADHLAAVGKMIFTFAIFWAYTTFVRLLIVWIADLPAEIVWYAPRITGGAPAGPNPWASRGFEWTTSSPPPKRNYEQMPIITRRPHNYHEPES